MLENLSSDSSVLKSCAEGWLVHSLHQGDIARLFDPILLILLDPGNARTSLNRYLESVVREEREDADDKKTDGADGGTGVRVELRDEAGMLPVPEQDSDDEDDEEDGVDGGLKRPEMKKSQSMPALETDNADVVVGGIIDEVS
jgi:hypothetical protein